MTHEILYWDGIVGDTDLVQKHAKVLKQILSGNYQSSKLDLKKLPNHRVYSAYTSYSDRLLFTTLIGPDKKRRLVLLGEVPNHDYHKSPFLKNNILKAFLEKNAPDLAEKAIIGLNDFVDIELNELDDLAEEIPDEAELKSRKMYFHKQDFIEFNDEQNKALNVGYPVIISGAAGSGKSCVALKLLLQTAQLKQQEGIAGHFVYIAQSPSLVREMHKQWKAHPESQNLNPNIKVEFKTYQQFYIDSLDTEKKPDFVTKKEFFAWFHEHATRLHPTDKNKKGKGKAENNAEFLEKMHLMYQEFRIMAAYDDAAYINLGDRQSLLKDKEERKKAQEAFKAYQVHLKFHNRCDISLVPLNIKKHFDGVVVDEAQDLSLMQINELFSESTAFCCDTNQSLDDSMSKLPFMLDKFNEFHQINLVKLPGSYRCPKTVIRLANEILKIKRRLTGGLSDKIEDVEIKVSSDKPGSVQWLDPDKDDLAWIREAAQSDSVVIITQEEFKEEAKARFGTELVFTAKEIKGLEYKTVVLYKPLDSDLFRRANKRLQSPELLNVKDIQHRAGKNSQGEDVFATEFNELFTSLTRATEEAIIVNAETHNTAYLSAAIKQGMPSSEEIKQAEKRELPAAAKTEDWLKTIAKLLDNDNELQAKDIWKIRIGKSMEEFDQFVLDHHEKITDEEDSAEHIDGLPAPALESPMAQNPVEPKTQSASNGPSGSKPKNKSKKKPAPKQTEQPKAATAQDKTAPKQKITIPKAIDYAKALALIGKFTLDELKNTPLDDLERYLFDTSIKEGITFKGITFLSCIAANRAYMGVLIKFLQHLSKENRLPSSLLFRTIAQNGLYQNTSIAYYLSQTTHGIDILHKMLLKAPHLFKEMNAPTLYGECRINELNQELYASLFSNLTLSPVGVSLLNDIYSHNPKLMKEIPVNALLKNCVIPITNNNRALKSITIESLASIRPIGPKILVKLLKAKPALGEKIPLYVWTNKYESKTLFAELCDIAPGALVHSISPISKGVFSEEIKKLNIRTDKEKRAYVENIRDNFDHEHLYRLINEREFSSLMFDNLLGGKIQSLHNAPIQK